MFYRVFLALALIACVSADCGVKWPNNTDTKYVWWDCGGDISFTSASPQFKNGTYEYPVHLNFPLIIMTAANNPKNTYTTPNLKQNITVYQWAQYNTCTWSKLPTFGLLNGLDACTNGVECPIKPGSQNLAFELDFSDVPQIIGLLTDDAPYQLTYDLYDLKLGNAVCLTFQARAYVH